MEVLITKIENGWIVTVSEYKEGKESSYIVYFDSVEKITSFLDNSLTRN